MRLHARVLQRCRLSMLLSHFTSSSAKACSCLRRASGLMLGATIIREFADRAYILGKVVELSSEGVFNKVSGLRANWTATLCILRNY